MPSKKRKYEARFPPARIKKIMQTDEEIGKVAAAVPVIISRSLEIFLQSLVETTAQYTNERKAKTMTTAHLKHCIESEKKFDFLKDLVDNIADVATQEEEDGGTGGENGEKPKRTRKPRQPAAERKKKKKPTSSDEDTDSTSEAEEKPTSSDKPKIDITPPPIMTSSVGEGSIQAPNNRTTSHSIEAIMSGSSTSSVKPPSASNFASPHMPHQPPPPHNQLPPGMVPQITPQDFSSSSLLQGGGLQGMPAPTGTPQMSSNLLMNLPSAFQQQQQQPFSSNHMCEDDDYDT